VNDWQQFLEIRAEIEGRLSEPDFDLELDDVELDEEDLEEDL
jgi:hypothetical protein